MNRILILFFSFIFFTFSFQNISAQVEKGNYVMGGTAGYEYLTYAYGNNTNQSTIYISPMAGYLLTDHVLVGGNFLINYNYGPGFSSLLLKGGPIMRYYLKNSLFIQADYNLGTPYPNTTEHFFYGRFGYAYFLNENVAIEPYIYVGYRNFAYNNSGTNYGLLDYGIYFSLQFYFESEFNKKFKNKKALMDTKQNKLHDVTH